MPSASCQTCISILSTDIEVCRCEQSDVRQCRHWRPHHTEIAYLCESALIGCRICKELWRYFFKEKSPRQYAAEPYFIINNMIHVFMNTGIWYRIVEVSDDQTHASAPTELADNEAGGDRIILALCFGISSPMIFGVEERQFILKKTSHMMRLLTLVASGILDLNGNTHSPSPTSEKRWDLVRKWITTCETTHQICSRSMRAIESSPWFPTRLIDVRPRSIDGHQGCILIETVNAELQGNRYMTLSHVWGSGPENQSPAYRTLQHNYNARVTAGIRMDDLPACFVDAIHATRKLGANYLWIDSLCIIQEDEDDWRAEAGQMSAVYQTSYLNLSATASTSSKDNLPCLDELLNEPRFLGTAWTGRYAGMYQIFDPSFWLDRVTSTKLASRGWIFQERALAPRILHFGFDQVLWECAETEAAEEYAAGIPHEFTNGGRRGFKWKLNIARLAETGRQYPHGASASEKYRELNDMWATALDNYTRCELSMDKDKLIAISGVVDLLTRHFGDKYIAGLWQSNLVGGLCWNVPNMERATQELIPSGLYAKRSETSRRADTFRAPSWSWASVDGTILSGPFVSDEKMPIQEAQSGQSGYQLIQSLVDLPVVRATEGNNSGGAESAELQVHGTMYRLFIKHDPLPNTISFHYLGSSDMAMVRLDQPEDPDEIQGPLFLPLLRADRRFERVTLGSVPGGSDEELTVRDGGLDNKDTIMGIVVIGTEGEKSYRRIGFLETKPVALEKALEGGEETWIKGDFIII